MTHVQASPPPVRTPGADPFGVTADAADLESLLPALRVRLIRQARFALDDDSLAEDLVQDTLMAVVEQHPKRRGDSSLHTWATAILKNKVADWYRSPTRKRFVYINEEDHDAALDALYSAAGSYVEPIPAWQQPDNFTEQKQMMTVLERCVSCLPRQAGRVFMMREWLGFDTAEICERLGVSSDNCRTILHRARMALRGCMQRNWIDARANA